MKQMLLTAAGEALPAIPWEDYPRPRLRREAWLCLNGLWDYSARGRAEKILVPFCPESRLSGVSLAPTPGTELRYERSFTLPEHWLGRRIVLHFGAVSRHAEVFVNGKKAAVHDNGYLPFSADVTQFLLPGENRLTVTAVNDLSRRFPWGKQREKRGGMWYTPVEPVPENGIRDLRLSISGTCAELTVEGAAEGVVHFEGKKIPLTDGKAALAPERPECWSPEHPRLYEFTVQSGEDSVSSYFALRSLEVKEVHGIPRLCLNGKPYFFNGVLDQGYWSDGLYTPAGPEAYARDILAMKALGFNTLRKHLKVEPARFYYDCDRLGMLVFQDMVNCGGYSYLGDTVLPTLGFQSRRDVNRYRDRETRANFLESMEETVSLLSGYPSVCCWTIFNEGWGQFDSDRLYRRLKELDPTRFVDSTSGWFRQKESDVESLHIYFQKLALGKTGLPQVLSEFGGWSYRIPAHSFNQRREYGYRKYKSREELVRDLRILYGETLPPLVREGLCGAIYTQLSDVEDETNGLVTYDRRVVKAAGPLTASGPIPAQGVEAAKKEEQA